MSVIIVYHLAQLVDRWRVHVGVLCPVTLYQRCKLSTFGTLARVVRHPPEKGAHLLTQRESALQMLRPHLGTRYRASPTEELLHKRQPSGSAGHSLLELVEAYKAALFVALLLGRPLLVLLL